MVYSADIFWPEQWGSVFLVYFGLKISLLELAVGFLHSNRVWNGVLLCVNVLLGVCEHASWKQESLGAECLLGIQWKLWSHWWNVECWTVWTGIEVWSRISFSKVIDSDKFSEVRKCHMMCQTASFWTFFLDPDGTACLLIVCLSSQSWCACWGLYWLTKSSLQACK